MIKRIIAAGLDKLYTALGHRKVPPVQPENETEAGIMLKLSRFIEMALANVKDPVADHAKYMHFLDNEFAPEAEKDITVREFEGRMVIQACIRAYLMGQGKESVDLFRESVNMGVVLHRCVSRAPEEFPATIHFLGVYDFSDDDETTKEGVDEQKTETGN